MGQRDGKDKLREDAREGNSGVQDNLFNYAAGAKVSEHLETTQLNKFGTKGGTGFAAEDANALNDKFRGIEVDQVGTDNAKNGADRIAGGVHIQTKYFDSAAKTVGDAFDSVTGKYRYQGMQLEVPSDQYDKAVEIMRQKIAANQVDGVTNPDDAVNIIKKGSVTYKQARNIARGGNIDSLKYDAKNNAITSSYAFAIGFSISFARAKWEGKSTKEAMQESVGTGFQSAGTSFIAGVAASQLLRTQMARKATVLVREGVREVAKTEWGRAAVDRIASVSAGKSLSGAAATNHVSKLLRSSAITGAVTTVVITGPDFYRAAISKNASWAQAGKNLVVNGAGVAAGTAGMWGGAAAGAAIGTAIFPGVGTTIGTVVGGLAGSIGAGAGTSYLTKKALDFVIEDDADEMLKIVQQVLPELADEFLLSQSEFDELIEHVSKACNVDLLREMYAQDSRELFVRVCFEPACDALVKRRAPVVLPVPEKVQEMLDEILTSIDEGTTDQPTQQSEPYVPNFVMRAGESAGTANASATASFLSEVGDQAAAKIQGPTGSFLRRFMS